MDTEAAREDTAAVAATAVAREATAVAATEADREAMEAEATKILLFHVSYSMKPVQNQHFVTTTDYSVVY